MKRVVLLFLFVLAVRPALGQQPSNAGQPAALSPEGTQQPAGAPQSANAPKPENAQQPADATGSPVVARAWLDEDQVRPGERVRLFVAIDNHATSDIGNIAFDSFETPGFMRDACWVGETPSCRTGEQKLQSLPAVAPNSSLVVSALLRRKNDELQDGGKVFMTGTFHWSTVPAGAQPPGQSPRVTTAVATTGPVEISSTRWYSTPRAISVREFGKDMVLPLLAVIGGYFLQRFQHARTERQVIWTEMLGKVTRDTEKHFLPLGSAVADYMKVVASVQQQPDPDRDVAWEKEQQRVAFYLLMLNWQVDHLVDTVGGFYLRMRSAETVLQVCWRAFQQRQQSDPLTYAALTRAVSMMKPAGMSYGVFTDRLAPPRSASVGRLKDRHAQFKSDVTIVTKAAREWICGPNWEQYRDNELLYLDILLRILDAEVDRPFQRWYGIQPHVNRSDLRRLRDRLRGAGAPKEAIAEALTPYLNETSILWQAGLSGPGRTLMALRRWREERREAQRSAQADAETAARLAMPGLADSDTHGVPPARS